jgi:5-methylcytosine-specific restriction endonuclease McrA
VLFHFSIYGASEADLDDLMSQTERARAAAAAAAAGDREVVTSVAETLELEVDDVVADVADEGDNTDDAIQPVHAFRLFEEHENYVQSSAASVPGSVEAGVGGVVPVPAVDLHVLPKHFRCVAHGLNLVGSNDFKLLCGQMTGENTLNFKSAVEIVRMLWHKYKSSTPSHDAILKVFPRAPKVEVVTRWNSLYDGIVRFVQDYRNTTSFHSVFSIINVQVPTCDMLLALKEYVKVFKPLATTLDRLQGEKGVYLGDVLPSINILIAETRAVSEGLAIMAPAGAFLVCRLEIRFKNTVLENTYYQLATAFHPMYKLCWLVEDSPQRVRLEKEMVACVQKKLTDREVDEPPISAPPPSEHRNDAVQLFLSMSGPPPSESLLTVDLTAKDIVSCWLRTPRVMHFGEEVAKTYRFNQSCDRSNDILQDVFLEYNTTLPSSASVERLFSYGKDTLRPKRCAMTDKHFQMVMLLKCNSSWAHFEEESDCD